MTNRICILSESCRFQSFDVRYTCFKFIHLKFRGRLGLDSISIQHPFQIKILLQTPFHCILVNRALEIIEMLKKSFVVPLFLFLCGILDIIAERSISYGLRASQTEDMNISLLQNAWQDGKLRLKATLL